MVSLPIRQRFALAKAKKPSSLYSILEGEDKHQSTDMNHVPFQIALSADITLGSALLP
jgi:hypothetical protein